MKTWEDPHVHGEPGHLWRWVKTSDGKSWERQAVADSESANPKPGPVKDAVKPVPYKPGKKVSVDVYYETRCPGCLLFINRTLEPLWRQKGMADVLNISMITYGNGMTIPIKDVSEGYKFWHPQTTGKGWNSVQICQHGADECLGNLVQLCTKEVAKHEQYMELIFCMAATSIQGYGEEKSTFECMQKNGIDHDKVRKCVTSTQGNELATKAGQQTHLLKDRKGTPWVMIEGTHVEDQLLMNTTLLMQSVCSHVDNGPVPCSPFKKPKAAPAPAPARAAPSEGDDFQVFVASHGDMDLIKVSQQGV